MDMVRTEKKNQANIFVTLLYRFMASESELKLSRQASEPFKLLAHVHLYLHSTGKYRKCSD